MADIDASGFQRSRPRNSRGQARPQYLDSPDLDRVFIMMMSMLSEVSALRDRLDTHEALADQGIVATHAQVEAYTVDAARQQAREAQRQALLDRVLRVIVEERDVDIAEH